MGCSDQTFQGACGSPAASNVGAACGSLGSLGSLACSQTQSAEGVSVAEMDLFQLSVWATGDRSTRPDRRCALCSSSRLCETHTRADRTCKAI
eukprot:s549_g4.t1